MKNEWIIIEANIIIHSTKRGQYQNNKIAAQHQQVSHIK